jgi:hypothetical protein
MINRVKAFDCAFCVFPMVRYVAYSLSFLFYLPIYAGGSKILYKVVRLLPTDPCMLKAFTEFIPLFTAVPCMLWRQAQQRCSAAQDSAVGIESASTLNLFPCHSSSQRVASQEAQLKIYIECFKDATDVVNAHLV